MSASDERLKCVGTTRVKLNTRTLHIIIKQNLINFFIFFFKKKKFASLHTKLPSTPPTEARSYISEYELDSPKSKNQNSNLPFSFQQ